MITGAGHHPNNTQNSAPVEQEHEINFIRTHGGQLEHSRHLKFPVLRRHQYFERRQAGALSLPPKLFLVSNDSIRSLPMPHIRRERDSYTAIFRAKDLQQRLWDDPTASPLLLSQCGDIADFEFYEERNALTAIHGYRAFTVELGSEVQAGMYTYTLRVADYKQEAASPKALHAWPLASRLPPPSALQQDGELSAAEFSPEGTASNFALGNSSDWSHASSTVSTDVFASDSGQWTSQRIARPGVARQLKVPGNINMVGRVLIDDERAYISLYDSQQMSDGQGHWFETKVSIGVCTGS